MINKENKIITISKLSWESFIYSSNFNTCGQQLSTYYVPGTALKMADINNGWLTWHQFVSDVGIMGHFYFTESQHKASNHFHAKKFFFNYRETQSFGLGLFSVSGAPISHVLDLFFLSLLCRYMFFPI